MRNKQKGLAQSSVIVMSSLVISRVTGFLRDTLIRNTLPEFESDAFFSALRITDLMYNLLIGGAIVAALIPLLTGYLVKDEEEEGWKAVSTFMNLIMLGMVVFCFAGVLFSPQIAGLYKFSEEKRALVAALSKILFPSVGFLMLAGLTNGVAYSYKNYSSAAFGPTVYNLGTIISLLGFSRYGVEKVSIGFMCSAFVFFVFQFTLVYKNFKYYRPSLFLKHPGFKTLINLAIPSLAISSIAQINLLISTIYTSSYSEGSLSAYTNASNLWQLPYGIFAMGLGTVLLPTLSEKSVKADSKGFRHLIVRSVKMILLLIVPSAVGIVLLGVPIISVVYKWSDQVNAGSILQINTILTYFPLALISQSVLAIITRVFYAQSDTKTPFIYGFLSILLNGIFCYAFSFIKSIDAGGMSLAYSLQSVIYTLILIKTLNKEHKFNRTGFLRFSSKIIIATLVMGLIVYGLNHFFSPDYLGEISLYRKILEILFLLFQIGIGALVYFAVLFLLKQEEATYLIRLARGKLKRCLRVNA